jgi:hypothetical protein
MANSDLLGIHFFDELMPSPSNLESEKIEPNVIGREKYDH